MLVERENNNSSWKKWEEWCRNQSVCPFSADIQSVLEFLTVQFEEGRHYRSLNCYRSPLSSVHLPIEGFPVVQHTLVCRLLKGVFNLRPPCPRYAVTWEVTHVLACVRSWGDNVKLDRKHVTRNLAVLLALVLAHRSSDLIRLSLNGRKYTPECRVRVWQSNLKLGAGYRRCS